MQYTVNSGEKGKIEVEWKERNKEKTEILTIEEMIKRLLHKIPEV